jgi:hypothetical protein
MGGGSVVGWRIKGKLVISSSVFSGLFIEVERGVHWQE